MERTRGLFREGKPLLKETVPGLRLELELMWGGGMRILDKIEALSYDVLHGRPVVSLRDKFSLLWNSLLRLS